MTQPPVAQPVTPQPSASNLKPHRGALVLALGIIGLVACMPCGIVAWVLGNTDLREMAAGLMDRSGEGMTTAGKIMGIVSVILWCGPILLFTLIGLFLCD